MSDRDGKFLSRWSRLKRRSRDEAQAVPAVARERAAVADAAAPGAAGPAVGPSAPGAAPAHGLPGTDSAATTGERRSPDAAEPPLPPIESLTPQSDFRPFMRAGVDAVTRTAALKRLFSDPQFNVMDGLDVYIDDYGKSEPIPESLLRRLVRAHASGLADPDADDDSARTASRRSDDAGAVASANASGAPAPGCDAAPASEASPAGEAAEPGPGAAPRRDDDPHGDADPCSGEHRG